MLLTRHLKNTPCQGASGKFKSQLIPRMVANYWVSPEIKFFSLSLIILFGRPLLAVILPKLLMNEVEFGRGTKLSKIALVEANV